MPKHDISRAFKEDDTEVYIKTHSDGVFIDEDELITLTNYINDSKFESATGTTTNIIVNMLDLYNGYTKSFIAYANNNGQATKINGKPLYKPNTTDAPNIIEGKAYTVWYDTIRDCFFLKASAEGNATAENVLADKKFSNDNDTGITGTMPNNGRLETTLTTHGTTYNIPSGYTSGGQVKTNITNCTAENIKYNVPVGGVTGSFTGDGTIDANKVVKNYIGYSKGSRIVGTATIQSLGGTDYKEIVVPAHPDGYVNKISLNSVGFKPSIIHMEFVGKEYDYLDSYIWLKNYSSANCHFVSVARHADGTLDVFERRYIFYDYTSDTNQYIMFQYETSYPLRVKCYK